ncbi:MAG: HEPN domain-containing protein [Microcoleus sp. PH2017_29_MFU_D_A]|uniref:HEPN domain-containing protein n=1 Tax=unclassified Microcoleus TaxID=2642155 RepID=UPI001E0EF353|nr:MULTISPECIES: HEPN domain-containing protein [unclassified Microcoleus]MCC3429772.1 HEPN domain-containing protein [Microcoleus sp. PH2017_04_SCI_O_A]MCC3442116.1 HEPN domain-containing protein [Microcoleus sp. PH2017_03_ELD_O_A]MCC3466876.1 HEPN domain-containing protein [Microcoleus sp. PH2017_06_SFM_O_A]MCC3501619.1 HEPN domain-containing protein [Microcoleus sp. PH2017_19_SFW_U_A]TAE16313.1 MAG: HEPN domain-containing protein [Oscillatoriales cyanobacterium]
MNRRDLQNIALTRLKEVEVLLENRQYSGAYYLSGYVVECALKACIAKQTRKFDFPDKKTVFDSYTHDLEKLVKVAKLDSELKTLLKDVEFLTAWVVLKDWSEESRYQKHDRQKALDIYSAITDSNHGILQWVQQHW